MIASPLKDNHPHVLKNCIATFSIVAYDPEDVAWGIAVASKFPGVGAVVPWARAGQGAVATQSYANTTYGPRGLDLMGKGVSAQKALDQLIADDDDRDMRQAGMVDADGNSATYSGEKCQPWAGGQTGKNFAAQGNILTGPETIQAMVDTFESTKGNLPARLFASLLAGDRAGGDSRGRQSAAIFVVKPNAGYGGFNDRWLDYRVDDHPDPVPQLGELIEMHELYFGESLVDDRVPILGDVAEELKVMMKTHRYYQGSLNGVYDKETREALRKFIGNENFEDRTDFENGMIDLPVLRFLRKKFSS
jgi:uncharacterized Ntn-hydrolase superfamily protein